MKCKLIKTRGNLAIGSVVDLSAEEADAAIRAGEAYDLATAEIVERQAQELQSLKAKDEARLGMEADAVINEAITKGVIAAKDSATQGEWKKNLTGGMSVEYRKIYSEKIQAQGKNLTSRITAAQSAEPKPVQSVEVIRTATGDAVRGYCAQTRLAAKAGWQTKEADLYRREAGRIFAAELDPVINAGGDFAIKSDMFSDEEQPVQATNVYAGNLILQRSLTLLRQRLTWLNKCGTDFSAEGAKYGQAIYTRVRTVPAVVDFSTNTQIGWASSTAAPVDKTVTLDAHKGVQVTFETETLGSTVRNLFQEISEPMSYSLAKAIADKVAALFTAANYTNTAVTKALADFSRLTVIELKDSLDTALNPDFDRLLLLSTSYSNKLLEDIQVVAPLYGGVGGISAGQPTNIHDFTVIGSQSLNALAGNVTGIAMTPSAVLVAARLPQDYTSVFPDLPPTATVEVVTEPGSGLSLQMVRFVSHQFATANMRVCLMYGAAVGQAAAGTILKSA